MHELIRIATAELVTFLAEQLPTLGATWWKTHVEACLSFQQQRTVRERGLITLEQLDFAALLRVLDQNWYELSQSLTLPREGRTWIRELQGVRNRWAHLSAAPVPSEDLYRDADTLSRVAGGPVLRIARQSQAEVSTWSNQRSSSRLSQRLPNEARRSAREPTPPAGWHSARASRARKSRIDARFCSRNPTARIRSPRFQ